MSEPKKVYVITKGAYSDYHICAVASDKNMAEKLCRAYTNNDRHKARIEEYDLNERPEDVRIRYCVEITIAQDRRAEYLAKKEGVV